MFPQHLTFVVALVFLLTCEARGDLVTFSEDSNSNNIFMEIKQNLVFKTFAPSAPPTAVQPVQSFILIFEDVYSTPPGQKIGRFNGPDAIVNESAAISPQGWGAISSSLPAAVVVDGVVTINDTTEFNLHVSFSNSVASGDRVSIPAGTYTLSPDDRFFPAQFTIPVLPDVPFSSAFLADNTLSNGGYKRISNVVAVPEPSILLYGGVIGVLAIVRYRLNRPLV
ncbi:MAG: hypothetical protein AAGB04_01390 [Pseudomonadota bacterium]